MTHVIHWILRIVYKIVTANDFASRTKTTAEIRVQVINTSVNNGNRNAGAGNSLSYRT